jgi:hypothetical protein
VSRGTRSALVVLVLALALLEGYWSLTRRRRFSSDSMAYVNAAANLLAGRGLAHDMLGFNQAELPRRLLFPEPFTIQGPLFPILIAAVSLTGCTPADAALLLPALAYPGILAAAFFLTKRLYDQRSALAALLLLALSYPLRYVSVAAWADGPGILLLLLSLLLLLRRAPAQAGRAGLLAAGLVGGLAFAVRYPLIVSLPVGMLLLADRDGVRRLAARCAWFALGFALVAAPVVARNLSLTGRLGGGSRGAATATLSGNLLAASQVLLGELWAPAASDAPQAWLLTAALLLAVVACRKLPLRSWLENRRFLLALFPAAYLAFMAAVRSLFYIDMDVRLMAPAHVFLACLAGALLAASVPLSPRALFGLLAMALLLRCGAAWARLSDPRAPAPRRIVRESPAMRFVRAALSERDLLIANNATHVTFFAERPTVALMARPYARAATFEELASLRDQACAREADSYLLLVEGGFRSREEWDAAYGPFVADLMSGRLEGYPGVTEHRRFPEGLLFKLGCGSR